MLLFSYSNYYRTCKAKQQSDYFHPLVKIGGVDSYNKNLSWKDLIEKFHRNQIIPVFIMDKYLELMISQTYRYPDHSCWHNPDTNIIHKNWQSSCKMIREYFSFWVFLNMSQLYYSGLRWKKLPNLKLQLGLRSIGHSVAEKQSFRFAVAHLLPPLYD